MTVRPTAIFLAFACGLVTVASALAQSTDRSAVQRATSAIFPSLVRITVVTAQYEGGREVKREAAGSGTIISRDGFVVTNHHVAGHVRRIICTLSTREEVSADLVGTDPMADIAVIKLHPQTPRTFAPAHFGDSSKLMRGDPVLAMGSPYALSQSVTRGIVSNTEMVMPQVFGPETMSMDGEDVGAIVRWIGHDASIYPGNSGGPLVNLKGEIVGINEMSLGLSAAIPGNLAKSVSEALIRTGHLSRSWIGAELQPLLASGASGALISWVARGSPAALAGIAAGDLLLQVNDMPVRVLFAEDLPAVNQLLFSLPIGAPSRFVFRCHGVTTSVALVPLERPAAMAPSSEVRAWGLTASSLSFFQASEMGRGSTDGVRVVSVRVGGPASQAQPSLTADDVIVGVNDRPIATLEAFEEQTAALLTSNGRASVLVAFDRGGEHRDTVVMLGEAPGHDLATEARKAWLPVAVQILTPSLGDHLGLAGRTGARVTRVIDPASGLRVGDVITSVDDHPVRGSSSDDDDVLAAMIREYAIGSSVRLGVIRAGAAVSVPVTLQAAPALPREMKAYDDPNFEFRVRNLAPADRDDPRLAGTTSGVVVDSVTQGGWAAVGHLLKSDIILAIDGVSVANVDDLAAHVADVVARRPSDVVFEVRRGIRTVFVGVQPAWK